MIGTAKDGTHRARPADAPTVADWAADERWWREHYRSRPYVDATRTFADYAAAYRYGFDAARRTAHQRWREAEPVLRNDWEASRATLGASWSMMCGAVQDAWSRVTSREREQRRRRASIHGDAMLLV